MDGRWPGGWAGQVARLMEWQTGVEKDWEQDLQQAKEDVMGKT